MQIVQPVAIKLKREILWLFQSEKNGVLYLLVFNTFTQRAYGHFAHAAIVLLHHYLYNTSHIKLHHGSLLHVVEHGHHGLGGLRRGHEFEDGAADHAEGAFGTHEQAAEVVAGRALDGAGAAFHQLAGVVIEFEAHDVIFGDAVFQAAQAAGVSAMLPPMVETA